MPAKVTRLRTAPTRPCAPPPKPAVLDVAILTDPGNTHPTLSSTVE